ncbi:MAG TPA: M56 family metallopeptidase [Longimicrobium sp.]|nr:M56 family metallopeptidase [Longimicrobium sp.]
MTPAWVGWLLAASTVRSLPVLAAAWLLARLLRRADARHAVWTAAVVAVLCMPLLLAVTPAVPVRLPADALRRAAAVWQRVAPPSAAVQTAAERGVAAGPDVMRGADATLAAGTVGEAPAAGLVEAAVWGWAAVAVLLLVRICGGTLLVAGLRRRARPISTAALDAGLRECRARYGIRRPVPLLASDAVAAPATVGWIRPAVLLPSSAADWTAEHAHTVLAHELAHVVRRDCLAQDLARIACALHWFNPLVHLAARRLRAECEHACDDRVILGGVRPHRYAVVLVETVRAVRREAPAAMLAMARRGELERRIAAILDPAAPRTAAPARGRRLALLLAVAALGSAALRVEAAPGQQAPPPAPVQRGEPDTRGDSVAGPLSERVPLPAGLDYATLGQAGERGPDSALVRLLRAQLRRVPQWEGDLVRDRAAWALLRMRGGRLTEPLLESLDDPDWRVRAYAAWALAQGREPRAVPALLRALQDPVWRLRAMAAFALSEIADPRTREAMTRALGDEAWQVRTNAVRYLAHFGDADARTRLRAMLSDRHVAVRDAAREALAGSPAP